MRILPNQTRIYEIQRGTWGLEIVWVPMFQIPFTTVRLQLDRSMIAKPSQNQPLNMSLDFGIGGISAGIPLISPGLSVSESGRTVEFRVFEISKSIDSMPTKTARTILFEWLNPSGVPPQVELTIEVRKLFLAKQVHRLVGYNIKDRLIEFVGARADTRFHFPSDDSAIRFQPSQIYETIPFVQHLDNTTVWGVSGPHEVWFWRTVSGTQYLVDQLRRYRDKGSLYEPIRVSLCPYDAAVNARTRVAFLSEMEVQHQCGVKVMMTDQKSLEKIIGHSKLAIAVFGEALGIMYHDFQRGVDEGYILIALDRARLHELRERFSELYDASIGWERYRAVRGVTFTQQRAEAITVRRDAILRRVEE